MAERSSIKVVEVCKVAPNPSSPDEQSLPLTFFDILWLRFPPIQRVFFFEVPSFNTSLFFDSVLPKLKTSLSVTLQHFVPLAGNLIWPQDSPPIINYVKGNAVSLTIAESKADFYHLVSSNSFSVEAKEYHPLIPHLAVSHDQAEVLALQITAFPTGGFSIGSAVHHAVLDGKTSTMFIKSWAHICKHGGGGQGPSSPLLPSYDRMAIKDPAGLHAIFSKDWLRYGGSNNRTLMSLEFTGAESLIRGSFEITRAKIESLRQSVMSMMAKEKQQAGHSVQLHLSTFSLTCAYTWVCLVKAEEIKTKKVLLVFNVDCRSRLDPPLPATYFGNCITPHGVIAETDDLMGEDGLFVALTAVSAAIKRLDTDGVLNGMETWIPTMFDAQTSTDRIFSVAGSPRFELYDAADFGWGRPRTIEFVSIDRTGAISLSDSKNGGGGVEIGLALKKHSMEAFASLFAEGLEQL
ncbi:unnamed protein product [Malus baccata var. baccata]